MSITLNFDTNLKPLEHHFKKYPPAVYKETIDNSLVDHSAVNKRNARLEDLQSKIKRTKISDKLVSVDMSPLTKEENNEMLSLMVRDIGVPAREPSIEKFLKATFDEASCELSHSNYAQYLHRCYSLHYGVVLTPDIIWHTIISEISGEIKANPGKYAELFTNRPDEKQTIKVVQIDPDNINLKSLIAALKDRIPIDIDIFFPYFTTTTEKARMVQYVTFADMLSPFYSYFTCACGIPKIRVEGEIADYKKLLQHVTFIGRRIEEAAGSEDVLVVYLLEKVSSTVHFVIEALATKDVDFFQRIYSAKRCGSGGEHDGYGWWLEGMYIKNYNGKRIDHLPLHISRVVYTNLDNGKVYSLNGGLFASQKEDGFLVPDWEFVTNSIGE